MEKKVDIMSYPMIYLKLKQAFLSLRNSLHKIDMIGCPNNFLTYCICLLVFHKKSKLHSVVF